MSGSHHSLSEDQVDDEEEEYPSGHEDIGCNRNGYVGWVCAPNKSQCGSHNPSHAETEDHTRHDKLLSPSQIDLKDCHVCDSSKDE